MVIRGRQLRNEVPHRPHEATQLSRSGGRACAFCAAAADRRAVGSPTRDLDEYYLVNEETDLQGE